MHPIVLTPALLATLLAGCNRAARTGIPRRAHIQNSDDRQSTRAVKANGT